MVRLTQGIKWAGTLTRNVVKLSQTRNDIVRLT